MTHIVVVPPAARAVEDHMGGLQLCDDHPGSLVARQKMRTNDSESSNTGISRRKKSEAKGNFSPTKTRLTMRMTSYSRFLLAGSVFIHVQKSQNKTRDGR